MTYAALGLALALVVALLRLYGLRGEVADAKALAVAREAERDAVLAELAAEKDQRQRAMAAGEAMEIEIVRLWTVLKETRSDAALERLLEDELG